MKKNILMIMTDQWHKYALGKITPYVQTPNLDRLASEGTLFTNAYDNNPVCTPFRANVFSGRYSKDNGVMCNTESLSPNELCLPDEMHGLGYDTSFVGKLHLGDKGNRPVPRKFRAGHNHFLGYQCYNSFIKDVCFYDEEGTEHRFDGRHRTDVTADLGIQRMQELTAAGKPWLHTIFFQAPHYPVEPSPEYLDLYKDITFPLPEDYHDIEPYIPTESPPSPRPFELDPNYQNYGGNIQEYLRRYYALITQTDANIGRILKEVDRLGIADQTVILFTGDHGDMQGAHGLLNKCYPYERSSGIPLIIKVPGIKQIPVVTTPVTAVDFYPTCMDIAGGVSRKELPGSSLLPLMEGKNIPHPPAYCENHREHPIGNWYMLRSGRFKIIYRDYDNKPSELFDLEADPTEEHNLIYEPAYRQIIAKLKKQMADITKGSEYTPAD